MQEPLWRQPIERRVWAARWRAAGNEAREWRVRRKKVRVVGDRMGQPMGRAAEAYRELRAPGIEVARCGGCGRARVEWIGEEW
jgi:hypothetical protein